MVSIEVTFDVLSYAALSKSLRNRIYVYSIHHKFPKGDPNGDQS